MVLRRPAIAFPLLLAVVPAAASADAVTTATEEASTGEGPGQAAAVEVGGDEPDDEWPLPPEAAPDYESVTTARRPLARDRTEDATAVGGEVLRETTAPSTVEALAREAADVHVPSRGVMHGVAAGATGGLRVRGLGGSPNTQVLVVEDDVPDFQGIFGHPIPDAYVPALLEQARIVKGGDSVLYGTNALGGVIVLRSRWLERDGWEATSDVAAGSYTTLRETATVLGRLGDWDLAGAFHGTSSEGHRDGAGGDLEVGQLAARYAVTPELRLAVRNKVVHVAGSDPGPATHPTPDHWFDVWRDVSSVRLAWDTAELRLAGGAFANVGVHRLHDGFHSLDYVVGGVVEVDATLHPTTELLGGVSASHADGTVDDHVTGEATAVTGWTDVAAYAQLTVRPVDSVALVAGGRALYDTGWGFVPLYKAGVRWDVLDGLFFRTRVARNYRRPTLRELYLPYPTANPELRPELALNWDFGAGWESEHFVLTCGGYRTDAEDLIKYFGSWPSAEVVNIDRLVVWGVEGRAAVRGLGPFDVALGGGWQDVGRYTRENPSAQVGLSVTGTWRFGAHTASGTLDGQWTHGLYMENYGRRPLPDAFVLDAAVRYRWEAGSFVLAPYLLLRNLLDLRVAYVEGYPLPGFHVLAGLRVEV